MLVNQMPVFWRHGVEEPALVSQNGGIEPSVVVFSHGCSSVGAVDDLQSEEIGRRDSAVSRRGKSETPALPGEFDGFVVGVEVVKKTNVGFGSGAFEDVDEEPGGAVRRVQDNASERLCFGCSPGGVVVVRGKQNSLEDGKREVAAHRVRLPVKWAV